MTSSTIPTTDMSSPQPKTSRESSKPAKHYKKEKGDAISTGKKKKVCFLVSISLLIVMPETAHIMFLFFTCQNMSGIL